MKPTEFYETYRNRHQLAERWKREGKKVLGYFCNYTPEELVYATGAIPVRIRGTTQNIDLADAHLPAFCCSFMRSALDQALKGRYSYLDGMVFPKSCDMTRALYSIWKRNIHLPYYYFLPVPGKQTDAAVEFFADELRQFKESLEGHTGQKITDKSLKNAIRVYNENRNLMANVYKLGLGEAPPISGSERYGICLAGVVMPKEEHSAMLRKLLEKPPTAAPSKKKVRLLVAGNTFEEIGLLQALEESGAEVVIDDLDVGTRYYGAPVDESAEPFRALAERYLRKVLCACKHPAQARVERMLELAKQYRAKGTVMVIQKYCDTHLYDRPWIESRLKEEKMPVLVIDHSDTGWVGGKFKTMVQAFIEMLE